MSIETILEKYQCIEKAQMERLYCSADPAAVKTEMSELAVMHYVMFRKNTVQLFTDKPLKPDPDLIASLWTMLLLCDGHMEDVEHAPDTYPFALRFTADEKIYRVLPVHGSMPANSLRALSPAAGETALLLLLDETVPDELIVPENASVIYVTYRRPDKWGKPFIKTYLNRELTKEI